MELIYRGRKYRSNNSIALKIIQERGYQVSHINQVTPVAIDRKFPLGQYVKQFFYEDIDTIYRPGKFLKLPATPCVPTLWTISN